jgi:hypothetical protein
VGSSLGRGDLAAQHRELVAQRQDLQVPGGLAAGQQHEQLDGAASRQVGEFDSTKVASDGQRSVTPPRRGERTGSSETMSEFPHPTGHRRPEAPPCGSLPQTPDPLSVIRAELDVEPGPTPPALFPS